MILCTFFFRSSSGQPIGICLIAMGLGIYLFYKGFRLLQRQQLILNTPASKIRAASMGMVELSGLAAGPYTLTAPVTAKPCYYHRTLVWELKQQGKNKQWVKVAAECMHVPFYLDDNTGKVMVDPRGAELDLHRDFQQEFCDSFFTTKEEVPPNVRLILSRHGINTTNKIKVEEFCIKPKNALFLLGSLGENPGLELNPRPIVDDDFNTLSFTRTLSFDRPSSAAAPPQDISSSARSQNNSSSHRSVGELLSSGTSDRSFDTSVLSNSMLGKMMLEEESMHAASTNVIQLSPPASPAKVSDMTQQQKVAAAMLKAGITNPAAWAAAGVTPSGAAAKSLGLPIVSTVGSTDGFDPKPPVVLMKGKNNPTFLISWRSQRELARSLGWKCSLMIWGGPALTLLGLWGFLTLTHML